VLVGNVSVRPRLGSPHGRRARHRSKPALRRARAISVLLAPNFWASRTIASHWYTGTLTFITRDPVAWRRLRSAMRGVERSFGIGGLPPFCATVGIIIAVQAAKRKAELAARPFPSRRSLANDASEANPGVI